MRRLSLFIFILLFMPCATFGAKAMDPTAGQSTEQRMDDLFGDHKAYKNFYYKFKDAVLKNKRKQVSELVGYPITIYGDERKYSIKNKTEFLNLYDSVFSQNMLTVIKQQQFNDLFVKWSGVMIGNGEVWFSGTCQDDACKEVNVEVSSLHNPFFFKSAKGKKAVDALLNKEKSKLHKSLLNFTEPVLLWNTKSYIIRIDRIGKDKYRYAAWNITGNQSQKPNIILNNGKIFYDGSGGNHHYEFRNGAYKYICYVNMIGSSETPPGSIEVFEKNKRILSQPVVKVLRF